MNYLEKYPIIVVTMREPEVSTLAITERLKETHPELNLFPKAVDYLARFDHKETDGVTCWRSDSVERRSGSKIEGIGLFALKDIAPGEIIAIKPGHVVGNQTIKENAQIIRGSHQQIGKNQFLTGLTPEEVDKNLVGYNHSCDPNAKIAVFKHVPLAFLVTKKPIREREEITTDYSVSQSSNTQRIFVCNCASPNCREIIQPGYDWMDEDFQQRHWQDFPFFIREEIEDMRQMSESELKAKKRLLYTLMSADVISVLADEIERRQKELDRIVQEYPGNKQLARMVLRNLSRGDIRKFKDLLFKNALIFIKLCPLANIEGMGIDRNNPKTIKQHLPELIAFAKKIDWYFN